MRRSGAMRAIAIGLVLLTVAPAVLSEENPRMTPLRLYEACKDRPGADSRFCYGILLGFVSGLEVKLRGNIWTWSCTGSATSLQIGYVAWAEKNAAKLDDNSSDVLVEALVAGGFCRTVKISTN